jgi:hypothetical protein
MNRRQYASPVIVVIIAAILIVAGGVWYWQKTKTHMPVLPSAIPQVSTSPVSRPSSTGTPIIGLPAPLYLSQMDACKAAGGQVKEETKNMGSWQALAQWECICKSSSLFFSDHLTCNQWLKPAL